MVVNKALDNAHDMPSAASLEGYYLRWYQQSHLVTVRLYIKYSQILEYIGELHDVSALFSIISFDGELLMHEQG